MEPNGVEFAFAFPSPSVQEMDLGRHRPWSAMLTWKQHWHFLSMQKGILMLVGDKRPLSSEKWSFCRALEQVHAVGDAWLWTTA